MQEFTQILWKNIKNFIKAQGKLFLIGFIMLSLGLYWIGIEGALFIGLAIAIVEILPLVGSALVLIPWTIYEWIWGDTRTGFYLLTLWLIVELVHNLLEPYLLGKDLNLPLWLTVLVTIVSLFLVTNVFTIVLAPLVLPFVASVKQYRDRHYPGK